MQSARATLRPGQVWRILWVIPLLCIAIASKSSATVTACTPCPTYAKTNVRGQFVTTDLGPQHPCSPGSPATQWSYTIEAYQCVNPDITQCCPDPALVAEQVPYVNPNFPTGGSTCGPIPPMSYNLCDSREAPKQCEESEPSAKSFTAADAHASPNYSPVTSPSQDPSTSSAQKVADPVDLTAGSLQQTATDLDIGSGLRFTRHYVTALGTYGDVGRHWTSNLNWKIKRSSESSNGVQVTEVVRISRPFYPPESFVRQPGWYDSWEGSPQASGSLSGDFAGALTYTAPDGVQVTFDASDQLTQIHTPGTPPISVTHLPNQAVFSNSAGTLTLDYSYGFVVAATANAGTQNEIRADYDNYPGGRLDTVTLPDLTADTPGGQVVWSYSHDGAGRLTAIRRTARGVTQTLSSWAYTDNTANGKVSRVDEPALAQPLRFAYSSQSGVDQTDVTDDSGVPLSTIQSVSGRITSASGTAPGIELPYAAVQSDRFRWKTTTDPNGNVTLYDTYDGKNRYQRKVEGWVDGGTAGTPDGVFSPDDAYARITEYTWHPRLRKPLSIRRESSLTGQLGDAETIYDYDDPSDPSDDPFVPNEKPTDLVYARIEKGKTLDATGAIVGFQEYTNYTYDADGHVTSVAGRRSENYTEYDYAPGTGYRTAIRRYVNGPGSSYLETTYSNFDAQGNPQTVTDPNGQITSFTFDGAGNVRTITPPYLGSGDPTITLHYDVDGRLQQADFPADTSGQPYYVSLGYDPKGNLVSMKDGRGSPTAPGDAVVYAYDRGKRSRTSYYRNFIDLQSPGTLVGDFRSQYSPVMGRLEKEFNPLFGDDSVFSAFTHDANGNTIGVTDENGKEDTRIYDALDRLVQVQQIRSGTYTTSFQYDPRSIVSQVTDPAGKVTDYKTDDLGDLVEVVSPDTGTTRYRYDSAGNLLERIDAAGTGAQRSIHYSYDGLDRLTLIDCPTDADWVFQYDASAADNQRGRLAQVSNGSVTSKFSYTARGDVSTEELDLAEENRAYQTTYTYDAAGNVESITTPGGATMTYSYAGDRAAEVTVDAGGDSASAKSLRWLPLGPLEHAEYSPADAQGQNQVVVNRGYNLRYQLEELDATGPQGAILDRSYTYDFTGGTPGPVDPGPSLDEVVDHLDPSQSRFYFYDEVDRLARVSDLSGNTLFQYDYDAVGNRLAKTDGSASTSYSYEPGTDRIASSSGSVVRYYAHDAYGNRIWAGTTPYAGQSMYRYNEANRLAHSQDEDGSHAADFEYDAFGRMVYRKPEGGTSPQPAVIIWGPGGHLLMGMNSYGDGSAATVSYVRAEGQRLGRIDWTESNVGSPLAEAPLAWILRSGPYRTWLLLGLATAASGAFLVLLVPPIRRRPRGAAAGVIAVAVSLAVGCPQSDVPVFLWFHTDPLGTPLALTRSSDGAVVLRATYKPFGEVTLNYDPDGDGAIESLFLRLPGQVADPFLDLYYNRFRYYDPSIGRYISADPIGQRGGVNLYTYARNNPLGFIDPFGLSDLVYDNTTNSLTVTDGNGNEVGSYPAANNAQSSSRGPWEAGTYDYSYSVPHEGDGPESPYGSNGNYVFNVPGCVGCGVHSGRATTPDKLGRTGPEHATNGCIRTTDEGTAAIKALVERGDPLKTLTVKR